MIARNSSFTYKGKPVDVKQVGRELGVRYVLEGSVRKAGNRVRVTGQLIDAATGSASLGRPLRRRARRYFRPAGPSDGQRRRRDRAEWSRPRSSARSASRPDSLDAYDYYLRAMMYFNQWTRESISEALRLFYKAIELDPGFATAHGLAAWCYVRRRLSGWMKVPLQEMPELERLARRAGELANNDAVALYSGGWALVQVPGYVEEGAALIDRALTLNPNMTSMG